MKDSTRFKIRIIYIEYNLKQKNQKSNFTYLYYYKNLYKLTAKHSLCLTFRCKNYKKYDQKYKTMKNNKKPNKNNINKRKTIIKK